MRVLLSASHRYPADDDHGVGLRPRPMPSKSAATSTTCSLVAWPSWGMTSAICCGTVPASPCRRACGP